ncbi:MULTISPECIES: oxalate/formate MFS antiporter [Methylobacterium]|uniref:Oxalate:formate antiporter n=2 Tax=Pseudomonadota TaxID=1224 RepID=A0ABQ4T0Z7_9HYPH|nr:MULTISPECIES: oxalate/formate MFS antiporter [Methylobacterium]PIU08546.1 MAG: oxalate/formate MFS antiporter [Methylobacterium sp. CG09_land_8_20_14_0_10_71_15]PIU11678.1 MAG: oxalate/formate MFS antiporter [Methylobacterium sp. CG08_land_8_20_14_0_20_71_15]GBU20102.1 oxalate/formate MFS antiporter [Methylobacterium sp.]GJE07551.1 Oxalate:formate antiporter [Methylobacterium jeotgali]
MSLTKEGPRVNRWLQLAFGVVCMCMIANMQYGWTFFVNPIQERHGWDRAAIQIAFTLFVVTETWLVPIEGWFVDKYGPRIVTLVGGALCGIAWIMNAYATSLTTLYIAAAIGGTGAGAVYGTCVGNSLKWFPDRRGLAAGITAMGFGAGSALTVVPIQMVIKNYGYESAFLWFGIAQGIVVMLIALFLVSPKKGEVPDVAKVSQSKRDFSPGEMVRTPIFWVMYAMFVMMAAGGLMATAQLGPIAKDFHIADTPVSLLGITLPALSFAATIDRVLNGVTRPFFGWVSDHIGRENTMFVSFAIEGVGIYALSVFGNDPFMFVMLTGLVFFAWGEIYSLFPAICGDTFGSKYAATNAGLLYTAKGTAALIVPYTSIITTMTGNWHAVFLAAAALNIIAALMAVLVLKPMRQRYTRAPVEGVPTPAAAH